MKPPRSEILPLLLWRKRIIGPDGPDDALTRHVLLTLSVFMDRHGRCFPSVARLVEAARLSKPTVVKYLKRARAEGWIRVTRRRRGQGWAHHHYQTLLPDTAPAPEASEVIHSGREVIHISAEVIHNRPSD